MKNTKFWDEHYAYFNDQAPSFFCLYCMQRFVRNSDTLVEIGCGNGRDGLELARVVDKYIGLDTSPKAISIFREAIKNSNPARNNATVEIQDGTTFLFERLEADRIAIYSRFSLHAMDYPTQARFLDYLYRLDGANWICMIEARTIFDELYGVGSRLGKHEFVTGHYRRFIDPQEFLSKIIGQFDVQYFEVARGFAMYKGDDPTVMRIVFGGRCP